jgi:fumarate reductase flavoprotein subunit
VIGGGLAGCAAALEAAADGATVLLAEKQAELGGSTRISAGFLAFAGTEEQAAQGIEDSPERLAADLLRVGEQQNDPALVEAFVRRQLDDHCWLKALGVAFAPVRLSSGQSVPRTHPTEAARLLELLAARLRAEPRIRVATARPARRLVRAELAGPVVGVAFAEGEGSRTIPARRGVVLASGGFTADEALLRNFAPRQAGAVRQGGPGNTGDGLRIAWALGAGLRDMGSIRGTFGYHPHAAGLDATDGIRLPIYVGAVAVNGHGRRFIDESLTYKEIGDACLQQPGGIAHQVFDRPILEAGAPGPGPFGFRTALERGWFLAADSLPALAAQMGVPPAGLAATLEDYNEGICLERRDAFGRASLSSGSGAPRLIEAPPFYAYASTSTVVGTYCGLSVDAEARVLDVFGAPIPGLWAAGEVTGGFHGASYMTGSALGKALAFGRIAGRNAASGAA